MNELLLTVRFATTDDGHIKSISFPEQLPDLDIDYLLNFMNDLKRSTQGQVSTL